MHFGGIQKNSLIDYPGKLSCVIFLSGCNFDCPYCHNPELVNNNEVNRCSLDEKALYGFLDVRKGFLDGVVVSGLFYLKEYLEILLIVIFGNF